MRFVDYHIHSNFSRDSNSSVDEIVKRAKEMKHKEICFTQHFEPSTMGKPFSVAMPEEKIPEYIMQVQEARKKYSVVIKLGLEVEYEKNFFGAIKNVIQKYPWDFVLGSVHCIEGVPWDWKEYTIPYFKKKTPDEVLRIYFEKLDELIESGLFDVISHADIFRRFWKDAYGEIKFEDYKKYAEKIIKSLKKNDVGFEVNASGIWKVGEQYPMREFIEMAYAAGIKKITIGSDTHESGKLSKDLDKVVNLIKEIGYTYVAVFDRRKVSYVPISEICGTN